MENVRFLLDLLAHRQFVSFRFGGTEHHSATMVTAVHIKDAANHSRATPIRTPYSQMLKQSIERHYSMGELRKRPKNDSLFGAFSQFLEGQGIVLEFPAW